MKKLLLSAALGGMLLAGLPTSLFATIVDAKTNIFVAGQDSTGINTQGGLFPAVAQTFVAGAGQTVRFAVTPSPLTCGVGPCASAGTGDGAALSFPTGAQTGTDITALGTNGISGIKFTGREMFLVGVFLDSSTPTGGGPFTPTFVSTGGTFNADTDTSFAAFFTGQVFFIGDGRTGFNNSGGTVQTWAVPTNATRLFLGFADAFDNFVGPWGAYGDNTGSLSVTVSVQNPIGAPVPEPNTIMLMGVVLVGLAYFRKRIA
jgi:PEP-CTERM motif-containing protein